MHSQTLIREIFKHPTAPFREAYISNSVQDILEKKRIPYFEDQFGNIIAGVRNASSFKKHRGLVFLAHMDHPGFHVISSQVRGQKTLVTAEWLGGAPFKKMSGAKVRIHDPESTAPQRGVLGTITSVSKPTPGKRERKIKITVPRSVVFSSKAFGAFAYPASQFNGHRLSGRVCDDLTGVALCLSVLLDTKNNKDCVSVFTRAEEVGFVGCWAQLRKNHYPKNAYFVSLEASKHLPNARLGKGPVIREGDRSTLFNSTLVRYMQQTAEKLKKTKNDFNYQMRRLDGGSCEATAIDLFGHKASGISLPLLNYHNEASTKPGPEIIDLRDFENMRLLIKSMVQNIKSLQNSDKIIRSRLDKNYKHFEKMLMEMNF